MADEPPKPNFSVKSITLVPVLAAVVKMIPPAPAPPVTKS